MMAMFLLGLGLGFLSTPYLLAVQNAVPRHQRGVATSSVQFFRTIGGSISVAALGAVLNGHLASRLVEGVDPNLALNPDTRGQIPRELLASLTDALGGGLGKVYMAMAVLAAIGIGVAFLFPGGSALSHAYSEKAPPPSG
jgi:hypothetical protein